MTAVAEQEGICVTSSHEFEGQQKALELIDSLTASATHVVVLYTSTSDTRALLQAAVNNPTARTKLLFLTPEPFTQVGFYLMKYIFSLSNL